MVIFLRVFHQRHCISQAFVNNDEALADIELIQESLDDWTYVAFIEIHFVSL